MNPGLRGAGRALSNRSLRHALRVRDGGDDGRTEHRVTRSAPPLTPDRRYIVVRGRLWRATRPDLPAERRAELVAHLMNARCAVAQARRAADRTAEAVAHAAVDAAKVALGERGAPWWDDGSPDFNRRLAKNTPYAGWFAALATGLENDG